MLPPIHRIDHPPIFVSALDNAWDQDRIAREERILLGVEELPEGAEPLPWDTMDDYPLTRYWSGESRGDLATVSDWLLPDRTPTKFVLRRLDLARWIENKQLRERKLHVAARVHAVRHGLIAIDDGPDLGGVAIDGRQLSDKAIQTVTALLGETGFDMLAMFIINASMEPNPLELPR